MNLLKKLRKSLVFLFSFTAIASSESMESPNNLDEQQDNKARLLKIFENQKQTEINQALANFKEDLATKRKKEEKARQDEEARLIKEFEQNQQKQFQAEFTRHKQKLDELKPFIDHICNEQRKAWSEESDQERQKLQKESEIQKQRIQELEQSLRDRSDSERIDQLNVTIHGDLYKLATEMMEILQKDITGIKTTTDNIAFDTIGAKFKSLVDQMNEVINFTDVNLLIESYKKDEQLLFDEAKKILEVIKKWHDEVMQTVQGNLAALPQIAKSMVQSGCDMIDAEMKNQDQILKNQGLSNLCYQFGNEYNAIVIIKQANERLKQLSESAIAKFREGAKNWLESKNTKMDAGLKNQIYNEQIYNKCKTYNDQIGSLIRVYNKKEYEMQVKYAESLWSKIFISQRAFVNGINLSNRFSKSQESSRLSLDYYYAIVNATFDEMNRNIITLMIPANYIDHQKYDNSSWQADCKTRYELWLANRQKQFIKIQNERYAYAEQMINSVKQQIEKQSKELTDIITALELSIKERPKDMKETILESQDKIAKETKELEDILTKNHQNMTSTKNMNAEVTKKLNAVIEKFQALKMIITQRLVL